MKKPILYTANAKVVISFANYLIILLILMLSRNHANGFNLSRLISTIDSTQSTDDSLSTSLPKSSVASLLINGESLNNTNVYSIQKLKDIRTDNVTNPIQLLSGKVAGLQVSQSASGTGGSYMLKIRGVNNLAGNSQPLFVVDGLPVINLEHSSGGINRGDIDYGNSIADINPWEIKSITVIKGPNAAAVYGSKANNGVVLITTKKGQETDGFGITLNSSLSFEKISMAPQFQNKYATGYEGTNLYGSWKEIDGTQYETLPYGITDSWGPPLDGRRTVIDPFVYPEDANTRTLVLLPQPSNNVKNFYDTGVINSNHLSVTKNSEKTRARFSLGNSILKGIVPNNKNETQTTRLNIFSQPFRKLSFEINANYIHAEGNNRPATGYDNGNLAKNFLSMGRYVPLPWLKEYYNQTGDWGRWPGIAYNPYYIINELKNNDSRNRFIGSATGTYNFTRWLSLTGRYGTDFYTEKRERNWPIGAKGNNMDKGERSNETIELYQEDIVFLLTANKKISKSFSANLSLGANFFKQKMDSEYALFEFANPVEQMNFDTINQNLNKYEIKNQAILFASQVGFKNYLFFDFSGRKEWNVSLPDTKPSFNYSSAGLSLIFTKALKINSDLLNFGKLRASCAKSMTGYSGIPTPFITDEIKKTFIKSLEVGSEIAFLKERLGVDFTYYKSQPTNLPVQVGINPNSGYSSAIFYGGKIENTGLEVSLSLDVLKSSGGLNWNITSNYSHNKSIVIELTEGIEIMGFSDILSNNIEARSGEKYGNIVGYKVQRAPGGQYLVNPDGAYTRESQKSVLGNVTPDWIGGINNTISYKGFSLNFLLDFVQGGQMSSSTKYQMTAKGTGEFTEEGRRPQDTDDVGNQLPYVGVLEGVVEITDNDGNVTGYEPNTKAVDGNTYWGTRAWHNMGEFFILDASYIILREATFGYSVQPSILKKTPFKKLNFNIFGRNLFYLEKHTDGLGISPESAPNTSVWAQGLEVYALPPTRTFGISLNVSF